MSLRIYPAGRGTAEPDLPEGHVLTTWVIYVRPADFPNKYVLRPQFVVHGRKDPVASDEAWLSDQPEPLRAMLPPGRMRMPPDPNPVILEVWL